MRLFIALLAFVTAASVGLADGGPPTLPPKGKKFVDVTSELLLDKSVTGHVFLRVIRIRSARNGEDSQVRGVLTLDEKDAVEIYSGKDRYRSVTIYAVPEDAAKKYVGDVDLLNALVEDKVKGAVKLQLDTTATVNEKIKGDRITWTYTITGVDAKKGIQVKVKGEGYEAPTEKKEEKKLLGLTEPGVLIGGTAAALAITLGGLWLVRRRSPRSGR